MSEAAPFTLKIRVRYGECDAQQVVFNARYGDYVDLAATEFYRALFGSYQNLIAQGYDTQVVRLDTQWRSPARFDEVLALAVHTVRVGNTSFVLQVNMTEASSGRAVAVAEITYVLVDARSLEKRPVPESVRSQLLAGAAGRTVNQSG
jgi:acyl-CoA thioester hydrolase